MKAKGQSVPGVFVLDNSRQLTGAFRSSINTSAYLKDRYHFTYWLPSNELIADVSAQGMTGRSIYFLELRKNFSLLYYLPVLLLNSIKIAYAAKKENVKIVHVNDLYNMCGVIIKIIQPTIKVVYHVRLLPESYVRSMYNIWAKLINRYADRIIVVSKAVASKWPGNRIPVIIYDVMTEPVQKNLHDRDHETIKLLYLSNFIKGKGHLLAIAAFEKAKKQIPQLYMTMVGGDLGRRKNQTYKSVIRNLVIQKNLLGYIKFQPFEKDVSGLLISNDIFLNFSESESFSMTCLEAMNSRIPVIATRCGGPEELIENGVSGILVDNRDVTEMSRRIVELASDHQKRVRLADAALVRIRNQFSFDSSISKVTVLYHKLLEMPSEE